MFSSKVRTFKKSCDIENLFSPLEQKYKNELQKWDSSEMSLVKAQSS